MDFSVLLPRPPDLRLDHIELEEQAITLTLVAVRSEPPCPSWFSRTLREVATRECAPVYTGANHHYAFKTCCFKRSNFARPYIWRLINFKRFTYPSTGPLLQLKLKAALTAA